MRNRSCPINTAPGELVDPPLERVHASRQLVETTHPFLQLVDPFTERIGALERLLRSGQLGNPADQVVEPWQSALLS